MPRQLAGFRWDDEKRRYFPLTSLIPSPPPPPTQPTVDPSSVAIQRNWRLLTSYHALSDLRSVCRTVHKDALIHQIRSSQILLTDKTRRSSLPLHGLISAFQTVSSNGWVWSFAGDTLGWFYTSVTDIHHQGSDTINQWEPQFNLSSEVSSIAVSPTACVATSFGPECKILYIALDPFSEHISVTGIEHQVYDVWTTDLYGSRLVLGANKQAVIIEDIAASISLRRLPTQSDVFALAQRENVLYAGLRSGSIIQFDTRFQRSQKYFFGGVSQRKSSITGLRHLHDNQLLVSFLDGGISTFDLRFPVGTPLMNFTGNVNTYTTRLPLAIDSHEEFLFVAGQDNMVRLWSLNIGGPALGTGSANQNVFERPFEHRIAALQVVEEREGMCLWIASGTELYKHDLGHRSGIGI